MSFSYGGGALYVQPNQHYGLDRHRRVSWWHLIGISLALVLAMGVIFVRMVFANIQPAAQQLPIVAPVLPEPVKQQPIVVAPKDNSQALQTDIDNWIRAQNNKAWAVDVQAIDGSLFAGTNVDKEFRLASIYKLFLLQPLAAKVPSSSWTTASIHGRSYASCVDAMLRISDNPCAEAIGEQLGWAQIGRTLQQDIGYRNIKFAPGVVDGTVRETTFLLQNLHVGEGFDTATRSLSLEALKAPKQAEGIRHGCSGCQVYNKTGDFNGVRHDAAIIEKNGAYYSVVIFSEGGSWQQIADLTRLIVSYF